MRRVIHFACALALIGAACGGSDSGTTTTGGDGTTSATTSPSAVTTTTGAAATTTEAEPDPLAARIAAAEAFAGVYEGEWVNTRFNSTGAIRITMAEVTDFGTLQVTLDVDGNAFGGPDPDEEILEVDLHPDPPQVLGSFLGNDATIEFSEDGTWLVTAFPAELGGGSLVVEVTITEDGFEGTYEVSGSDGAVFAEGRFTADRTG
jgi:hypothetical protein